MRHVQQIDRMVMVAFLAVAVFIVAAAFAGAAAAAGKPGDVTGLRSTTHPDESTWYSSSSPSFVWKATPAPGHAISGYSFVLDQKKDASPDSTCERTALTYETRVAYAVGSRPAEARIVDLNHDGKPDLVVENYGSNTVSVLLGKGDSTFQPAVNYPTAAGPWSMAIGDVNNDGKIDIVTGNYGASNASVLLGNGDGTFQPRVDYTVGDGTNPECLRMGDVNGDGNLDIFTANASTNTISVLMGDGHGSFGTPTTFSTPTHPTSIDLCDVNGDGKQDLVTANYAAGSVSVLLGDGTGIFGTAVNYAVSGNPQMVLAVDLNGDGHPDMATVNWGSNTASILLNKGDKDGTFAAKTDYQIGNGPYAFSVADLNSDGAPDLVTANYAAGSVSVLYGNGDGTFAPKTDFSTGSGPFFVALGDLNGDGYGDMVTTDMNDGKVSVFRGTAAFLGTSFPPQADGEWYFHVCAVDSADEVGNTATCKVRIDTRAPNTSDASAPTLAAGADSAWCTTSQTVTLLATDGAGSGVASIHYVVGPSGTEQTVADDTASFSVSGDGSHRVEYWAVDAAGNAETHRAGWVNIDSAAPLSSDASSPALALDRLSGWQHAAQLVTLSAADVGPAPVSGLAGVEYDLDNAGYVPYTAPFIVAGQGSHTLLYRAFDKAGNVEPAQTAYVNIDTTAPTITSSADTDTTWHNGDVPVTLTDGDGDGSGVAKTQYRAATSGAWSDAAGGSFTIPAAGENGPVTYEYRAIDKAGNETTGSCTVNFDTIAPTTSDVSTTPLAGNADSAWRTTSQQVTIAAADVDGSGVVSIHYVVGPSGTEQTVADDTASFSVSGDGSHSVEYWAVDAAGNVGASYTGWANIWATAPVTSANSAVSDSADGDWHSTDPQTVALTATGGHGTSTIHYKVDDAAQQDVTGADAEFTVSGDRSHMLIYWTTDALGNKESQHTGYVNIDTTAPVTSDDYAGGTAWQTGPVSISLTPSDAGSGMTDGSAATTYKIDDQPAQSGTTAAVTGDGEHKVTYFSTDNAGNVETPAKTVTVRIDAAAPATADDAPLGWQSADTTVTLTPEDLLSGMVGGLAKTTFEIGVGATQTGTIVHVDAPDDHSNDGKHVITYRSMDAAGNLEPDKTATVLVDTLAPVTRDDIAAGPPAHTDPITVTLHAADDNGTRVVSGVAATHYSVDGGDLQTGTSVQVSGDGQHTIDYYSTDNAGNREATKTSKTLTIGTTPPGASRDDAPGAWMGHPVTVTITPGARAVRTTWELDGGSTQTGMSALVDAPATHANDGIHTLTYRSSTVGDVAETTRTAVVRIDTTAPSTSDNAPAGWQHGPVTLTLSAADQSSGLAGTTYSIDGGAEKHGTSVEVGGDGTHTIRYYSADNAGNVETARTAVVRIDATAPQVTCAQAGRWFKTKTVKASFVAGDAGSGLHDVAYRIGQGAWQSGSSLVISGLGPHAVGYRATDVCGNVTTGSCMVGIDRGRP
ncbi:MAG TPA: FG-GAP-like repeat-containing protein, partial [Thermoleophilia bacterium]|nr:FG-GAP-like repeat-containing protein [Thermoleophilia bacterium]